jgi:hypothetical protein
VKKGAVNILEKVSTQMKRAKDSDIAHIVKENVVTQKLLEGGKAVGGFFAEKARIVGEKIEQNEGIGKAK